GAGLEVDAGRGGPGEAVPQRRRGDGVDGGGLLPLRTAARERGGTRWGAASVAQDGRVHAVGPHPGLPGRTRARYRTRLRLRPRLRGTPAGGPRGGARLDGRGLVARLRRLGLHHRPEGEDRQRLPGTGPDARLAAPLPLQESVIRRTRAVSVSAGGDVMRWVSW